MSHEDRSEALLEVLEELEQSDIGFVLVGGYAISQFETRSSTDLDIVIAPDDYDEVVAFLEARSFKRQADFEGSLYSRGLPPRIRVMRRPAVQVTEGGASRRRFRRT